MLTPQHHSRIREINDALRTSADDIDHLIINGSVVITRSLMYKGDDFLTAAIAAMRNFRDFDPDNDPHSEHDFAMMEVWGETVIWKIDYYAPDLQHGSEEPWDAGKTRRVLTLMLGEDY